MIVTRLTNADYTSQPWKNGVGNTTQIAIGGNADAWAWRVSVADVQASGPFSDFAGFERTIALLEGNGMLLSFDRAHPRRVEQLHVPFAFDGAWKTHCHLLDGPVRDLNLIVARHFGHGNIDIIPTTKTEMSRVLTGCCDLFYGLSGAVAASVEHRREVIGKGDALRIDDGGSRSLELHSVAHDATIAHISIQRR